MQSRREGGHAARGKNPAAPGQLRSGPAGITAVSGRQRGGDFHQAMHLAQRITVAWLGGERKILHS